MRLGSASKRAQSVGIRLVANLATLESIVKVLDGMGQMLYFKFK
jgi:RNA polymerase-interacting CarD/CdnL/TRCF family regulator